MTIHRALSELKLIDARISKKVESLTPSACVQTGKTIAGTTISDFEKEVKSVVDSIQDLLARKTKIKSAIVIANSVTTVGVAGEQMSISDAINKKYSIELMEKFINIVRTRHATVKADYNKNNEKLYEVALQNARVMLGRPGDETAKPTDADVAAIMEPFIKRNEYILVDPIKCDEFIKENEEKLEAFKSEVDSVLSEANATTFIEV